MPQTLEMKPKSLLRESKVEYKRRKLKEAKIDDRIVDDAVLIHSIRKFQKKKDMNDREAFDEAYTSVLRDDDDIRKNVERYTTQSEREALVKKTRPKRQREFGNQLMKAMSVLNRKERDYKKEGR